ncbi:Putative checkpoint protein Rad17/Rad24 [Septoria linicola]|uniref:Checkpoint protein Rad17/Rad24 n=1 Tax=Septoria linicola TaxID=215465 RepID=A0A9Q9EEN3_9PEZI|nr:putative checkpoint protein Rad17/Rad24 [Septoria linicola]USW47099.1 Putative checkpoint protein Rad17/Rad24 [Septoria linicola]
MAPRDSHKASHWVEPDRTVKRIWKEGDEIRLKPLSNALSKPKKDATEQTGSLTNLSQGSAVSSKSPQKPQSKRKAAQKEQPKATGRSIHSFFNNATQKQQGSQYLASPEKLTAFHDEIEVIEDESDEDKPAKESSQTTLSRGSSTAIASRKRKIGQVNPFEQPPEAFRHASQKFRKVIDGGKEPTAAKADGPQQPWTDRFGPVDLTELAVHKRKVGDVRNWLEHFYQGRRPKVLVLQGAAGTGKTTTIQLLAKELGIELIDWKESSAFDNGSDGVTASSARFAEFVARAGRAKGLDLSNNKDAAELPRQSDSSRPDSSSQTNRQALLVEEFPNTFSRSSVALQSFRTALAQYVLSKVPSESSPVPVIMIVSESLLSTSTASADSFTAHRLLGPDLVTNSYIDTIEFNAIAPTILTKALETIVIKEARKSGRRRTPGHEILKRLAESGDIRSAVSSLQFLCVRGDEGDTWSSKVTFTKPKQSRAPPPSTQAEREALKLVSNRESSLGIFHSVGKVVYNKRVDASAAADIAQPPPWLSHHNRLKATETNPNTLIDELGTDTSTFIAALHENYALSCAAPSAEQRLDSLLGSMENLSDSDLLSLDRLSFGNRAFSGSATDTLRQDEMCFQVAVRGLLFSLPHPVHRSEPTGGKRGDAHRMFYPASLRLWRKKEETETNLDAIIDKLAFGTSISAAAQESTDIGADTGIESWKQRSFGGVQKQKADGEDLEAPPRLSTQAKNEMILDHLPYMVQILSGSKASAGQHALGNQIRAVTRMDRVVIDNEDEDADAEPGDQAEGAANTESWSTDQPHVETQGSGISPSKPRVQSRPAAVFKSVSMPVEKRVQSLILEDDDIED